jgi:hypothetical protein
MKKIFLGILLLTYCTIKAQDTLSFLSYNILNYPSSNATKADTLKPIIKYTQPDIFMINELTSVNGVNTILNDALNEDGITYYQKAVYFDGPDTDNMLYYNSEKLTLLRQHQIPTVLRDISEYVMYYNLPNMTTATDTIFIYCYIAHLKASSGASNEQQRNQEAVTFKNYLDTKSANLENIFFGGDFNIYSSSEPAHNTILNGGSVLLLDPISSPGAWNNNASFASIHTQSTRSNSLGDGGAYGGLDDRFDWIFTSTDVMNGTNKVSYINNSYTAIGNDGLHFNKSINAAPTNIAVPQNVADALYYMSDHLPVYMKVAIDLTVGVNEQSNPKNWEGKFYNQQFHFKAKNQIQQLSVNIYDLLGKKILTKTVKNQQQFSIRLNELNKGIYLIKVISEDYQKSFKIYKK